MADHRCRIGVDAVARKKSIAAKIIEGLTEFAEALESGKPLETQFSGHTLAIDLVRQRTGGPRANPGSADGTLPATETTIHQERDTQPTG